MSMKMKGLLKGLRYISTIFDEEEETEMQIGFPTDVKHVAHIGWDGPTANSPSWINQFKDSESGGGGATPNGNKIDQQNAPKTRDQRVSAQEKRASTGSEQVLDSPSRRKPKGSRRASSASASASGTDSPRNSSTSTTEGGDPTGAGPKRRKKPKGSSSGGPSSSRTTNNKSKPTGPSSTDVSHYSDPGIGRRRLKGKDTSCQGSVMKTSEQEDQKALDDISRGIQAM